MSYKKGKDIKVPFDCLWHCYTRGFRAFLIEPPIEENKPEEFEKW